MEFKLRKQFVLILLVIKLNMFFGGMNIFLTNYLMLEIKRFEYKFLTPLFVFIRNKIIFPCYTFLCFIER